MRKIILPSALGGGVDVDFHNIATPFEFFTLLPKRRNKRGDHPNVVAVNLRRKRLRCALDVSDPLEPLPVNHPLRNLAGSIVTPHIAGSGRHVRAEIADTMINDLEKFFKGKRVQNRVSRSMLERMT